MAKNVKDSSIAQTAFYNLEQTAKRLGLKDEILANLADPKEKIEVTINPSLPDGRAVHVKAFVVRHSDSLGPAKGGIRMIPSVSCDDIVGLAMEMTWKTALIEVPFGGGKSGICFDSTGLSASEKEVVVRSFVRGIRRHMGPEIYIPAPDMGTNEEDMGHVRDCIAYSNGTSITDGCFVTGKPVILGGIIGRREATGNGVVYTTLAACEKLGIDIKDARVAVQGFGNVGSVAAGAISDFGAKVIAVSDITGAIKSDKGLDVTLLQQHVKNTGSIKGFKDAVEIVKEDIVTVDCDILIPAATQSQITQQNAAKVKAKVVAEGANSPTTPKADEKGIFVIPDILCNAGGVFVSYLEYTQETQREQMTLEQVQKRLQVRMYQKFDDVYGYSMDKKLSMRDAAMDLAVSRVVEAVNARGMLP